MRIPSSDLPFRGVPFGALFFSLWGCFSCCFLRFCPSGSASVPSSASASVPSSRFLSSVPSSRLAGCAAAAGGGAAGRLAVAVFLVSAFPALGSACRRLLSPSSGGFLWVVPAPSGRLPPLSFLGAAGWFSRSGCSSPWMRKQKSSEAPLPRCGGSSQPMEAKKI